MIEEEEKEIRLSVGKLDILPHFSTMKAFGFGFIIGEGVFWNSIRFAVTLGCFYFDTHFIWDNKGGQ